MKLFIFEEFSVGRWLPIKFFSGGYRDVITDINAHSPNLPWNEYRLRRVMTEGEVLEMINARVGNESMQLPYGTGGYQWV